MAIVDVLLIERRRAERTARRAHLAFCRSLASFIDSGAVKQRAVADALGVTRETIRVWAIAGRESSARILAGEDM